MGFADAELNADVAAAVSELTAKILRKDPKVTAIIVRSADAADWFAGGRSLGRGNLFIYTLPSSTMGEIAIALGLRGPAVHIHDAHHPAQILIRHARRLLEDGEADGILALWSDSKAAVCFAVDGGAEDVNLSSLEWDQHPHEMAHALATMVQPT